MERKGARGQSPHSRPPGTLFLAGGSHPQFAFRALAAFPAPNMDTLWANGVPMHIDRGCRQRDLVKQSVAAGSNRDL
jgi:hypothetical protein